MSRQKKKAKRIADDDLKLEGPVLGYRNWLDLGFNSGIYLVNFYEQEANLKIMEKERDRVIGIREGLLAENEASVLERIRLENLIRFSLIRFFFGAKLKNKLEKISGFISQNLGIIEKIGPRLELFNQTIFILKEGDDYWDY